MVLKKRIVNGFTLIELLVVIGVLLVVLAITLIAINPTEQFGKTNDVVATAISNDFVKSNNEYFTREKSYPWEKDLNCKNEIEEGHSIYDMPSCITQLTKGGQIDNEYKKNPSTKEIYGKKCGEKVVICYQPKSKKIYTDAKYNKFGVTEPGCPGSKGSGKDCYWCKPVNNKGMCDGDPTPTSSNSPTPTLTPTNIPSPTNVPTSTPTPTNTPSPTITPTPTPSNPWGNAAVFHGKVGGLNPPTYSWINQFMEVTYDPKLNLTTNNVTVEAWIKPEIPTGLGYDYAIAQNEFTLTMDARQNGPDISYRYYFDVLSSTNGCGRTVVYSDTINWYPWSLTGPPGPVSKTVTPSDFIKWKHIAGVMQNGNLNIYENGVKLATYNIGMTVCKRDLSFLVGARDNGPIFGAPWYYNFFQGAIDEVRISDVARYTNNFVPQKLPFTADQNTKMLYHFNSNTQDSSANSLNGNLVGGVTYINSDIPTD